MLGQLTVFIIYSYRHEDGCTSPYHFDLQQQLRTVTINNIGDNIRYLFLNNFNKINKKLISR